jgi:hypothetical protein
MELSDYELVRYPSGQLVLIKSGTNAQGLPASGPKDVIGSFTDEAEARSALAPAAPRRRPGIGARGPAPLKTA